MMASAGIRQSGSWRTAVWPTHWTRGWSRLLLLVPALPLLLACQRTGQQPSAVVTETAVFLPAAATATPRPAMTRPATSVPATATLAPAATPAARPAFYYAMAMPVANAREARDLAQLDATFAEIKPLGVNMVVQIFDSDLTPDDWRAYLDVAHQAGLLVTGKIGPTSWNPDPADLSPILDILAAVADHPAFYGFFYLHEPWELFTTGQMQTMYRTIKAFYPEVRLGVGWSGQIYRSLNWRRHDQQFADDLCDICLVNLKPFQADPATSARDGLDRLRASADHIREVDPDAELWSSAQVWAPPASKLNPRGFRMPTPSEMEALFCALRQEYPELRGFFWEVWTFDRRTVGALSDPDGAASRQAVYDIYWKCVVGGWVDG